VWEPNSTTNSKCTTGALNVIPGGVHAYHYTKNFTQLMQLHLYQRVLRFVGQLPPRSTRSSSYLALIWLIVIIIIIRHEAGLDRPLLPYMVNNWRIFHVKWNTRAQTNNGELPSPLDRQSFIHGVNETEIQPAILSFRQSATQPVHQSQGP